MAMRARPTLLLSASMLTVSGLALAGCGAPLPAASGSAQLRPAAVPMAAAAAPTTCNDGQPVTASLAPAGISTDPASWPAGSTMAQIRKRGYLRVATNGDVMLWGATDTSSGNPVGYDVDLAAYIATVLGVKAAKTVYTVIPYSQREAVLQKHQVDLVAQQMTINCARWQGSGVPAGPGVNFSAPYYTAGAKLLVRSDSPATRIQDLKGQSVCGTASATSAAILTSAHVKQVTEATAGQCLVDFEEGEVTAVIGDETTLAGFVKQDPRSKTIGTALNPGSYGLGLQPNQADFTRFVNAVLEKLRTNGTLTALYNKWMKPTVGGSAPVIGAPVYGRDLTALKRP